MGAWVDMPVRQPPPLGGYLHPESKMKTCTKCGETYPLTNFYRQKNRSDGLSSWCKPCKRAISRSWSDADRTYAYRLMREFGMTPDDYEKIHKEQGGRCAICSTDNPGRGKRRLSVDHCHSTGDVRGLLCNTCNRALGLLNDSIDTLQNSINYLRKHNGTHSDSHFGVRRG